MVILKKDAWGKTGAIFLVVLVLVAIIIIGFAELHDPEVSQTNKMDVVGSVRPGHSIGQTVLIRRTKMSGITLWLDPTGDQAQLTLDVFSPAGDQIPVFSSTFQVLKGANPIEIQPPLQNNTLPYYFRLRTSQAEIAVLGRNEEAYLDGAAYAGDIPIEGDLAFQTTYKYDGQAILSDLGYLGREWLPLLAIAPLLIFPGWLILDGLGLRKDFDFGEQTALSVGLSLAVIPLLLLWTSLLNLTWTQPGLQVSAGAVTAVFLWRNVTHKKIKASTTLPQGKTFRPAPQIWFLVGIFLFSFFLRVAMVRDLTVPPWVDSIHHGLITRRIIETGAFPDNYLPHIPLEAHYYHPGYHSNLAAYHWLSGLDIPQAMLFFGQALNSFSVFAVYALTSSLLKDKTAAVIAALVTGLFSVIPAYYTSWGRYTQLTGLLILPATLILFQKIPTQKKKISWLIPASFSLGGLILVHYRVAFFTGCLLLAVWIGTLYRREADAWVKLYSSILNTTIACVLSVILIAPWLLPTISDFFLPVARKWGLGNPGIPAIHWRYLTVAWGIPILVLAGLGLLSGLLKRNKFSIVILLWIGILFLSANPGYFHLPFPSAFVNQNSVEIMLFLPISICAGYFLSEILSWINSLIEPEPTLFWKLICGILSLEMILLGAQNLLPILNPDTVLFRASDQAALEWIKDHLPEGETVVINPTGWGYGLYMGQDGGYWISPITDHPTMPPNVLYGFSGEQRTLVNHFVETLLPIGENPKEIWKLLNTYGYKTIFIGTRGGVLSPKALAESPLFKVRYQQGITWVFEAVGIP